MAYKGLSYNRRRKKLRGEGVNCVGKGKGMV